MTDNMQLQTSTFFAPPGRATQVELENVKRQVMVDRILSSLLEAIPDYVLILNRQRQVVAANSRLIKAFGLEPDSFIGKRPGEVLGCVFSTEGPEGCGTGIHCSVCGAVASILESQKYTVQSCHECLITIDRNGGIPMELEVISNPATVDGIPLTVCILRDISDSKRRGILERVFFHDLINTAGGIHGIASILAENQELPHEREREYKEWMLNLSNRLIEEINHHRRLLAAERGEFKPDLGLVRIPDLMGEIHALYSNHDVIEGRILEMGEVVDCTIESDGQILRRILGNLVKNAIEATPRGGTVHLSCTDCGDNVTFSVSNPGVMAQEVQLQIFRRSFSTKGVTGRGIGTYSVKLFGERYLKGKVFFRSQEPEGTTFYLSIPKHYN